MKRVSLTFLKNFLIAGTLIGLYSIIMELYSPELVGFIHGALPITFTYLIILTYIQHKHRLKNTVYFSMVSGLFWIGYVAAIYLFLTYGLSLPVAYSLALILFVIVSIVFCKINSKEFIK